MYTVKAWYTDINLHRYYYDVTHLWAWVFIGGFLLRDDNQIHSKHHTLRWLPGGIAVQGNSGDVPPQWPSFSVLWQTHSWPSRSKRGCAWIYSLHSNTCVFALTSHCLVQRPLWPLAGIYVATAVFGVLLEDPRIEFPCEKVTSFQLFGFLVL